MPMVYSVITFRLPAELADEMRETVKESERYRSNAQFLTTAIRRLITYEKGVITKKKKGIVSITVG